MDIGQHTSHEYNEELENVRNKVLTMGGLVERQLDNGFTALMNLDVDLAQIVAESDYEVNSLEVEIDEDIAQIIARRQPAATDLRLLIAILKSITDLERIGDEAEKMGRIALELAEESDVSELQLSLKNLADQSKEMLHNSLDAYARMDADKAIRIASSDVNVNREFESVQRVLITHMMEDPSTIKNSLKISWCARSLERIGDHSKNICEYIIYLVKGKDVRHKSLDEMRSTFKNS